MSNVNFNLATGPFQHNWSDGSLITSDNDWSGVPSIEGFLGQDIVTAPGADAGTALTDSSFPGDLSVLANQVSPGAVTAGGVAEFEIADPTIALERSATADAPYIVVYLDATGQRDVTVSFSARDIDHGADNAIQ